MNNKDIHLVNAALKDCCERLGRELGGHFYCKPPRIEQEIESFTCVRSQITTRIDVSFCASEPMPSDEVKE